MFPLGQVTNTCHGAAFNLLNNLLLFGENHLYLTAGEVVFQKEPLYGCSPDSLVEVWKEGFAPEKDLNCHVWLTTPDMKVLDPSVLSTLVHRGFLDSRNSAKAWLADPDIESDLKFIPMFVHNSFVERVDRPRIAANGARFTS